MKIRTRWKNWRLEADRRKLEKKRSLVAKEAREKNDEDILHEWNTINGWEFDVLDAAKRENVSRDVLDQAESLYLPTPAIGDREKWVPSEDLGMTGQHWKILTPEAMKELSTAIRQERREGLEIWESRAKIVGTVVASLTGIGGAIIGLIAISKK
jgi:hypothetical protein